MQFEMNQCSSMKTSKRNEQNSLQRYNELKGNASSAQIHNSVQGSKSTVKQYLKQAKV